MPILAVALPSARATAAAAAAVVVDPSARRQTIRGFGGMNHPEWAGDLTAAQRDTAFGNSAGQLGFSILRIHVDEDRSNWSKEVATAQRAVAHGAIVFASPWNPPANMVETFTRGSQTNAQRLRYDMYGAYAQHLNDFTQFMKDNGVDLYAISIQNEPDYASTWTWWTASEIVTFLRNNAGSISTRVIAPESFQYIKSMSDPILNDSTALATMDILGAHLYGTAFSNFPYPLFQQKGQGKELWMTEVYYPNSTDSADLWPAALGVGEHMHHAMVDAEFQAYVWWYIRRSYGPMREDGQISKRGAIMAHFSKFVRPGYVRINAASNPQTNVYTSAYTGGSTVVIVAVNKATSAVSQQFTLANTSPSSVASYVTDAGRTLASLSGPSLANGTLTASLPAQSVTTFVVSVGSSSGNDTQAPSTPGTLTASQVTSTSVTLSWAASTDNTAVTGYDVVRLSGSTETAAASSTTNQATVTGLTAGTAYTFAVYARDAAGNRSSRSSTVGVTTSTGTSTGGCGVGYRVTSSWSGGFQGELVIQNTGTAALDGWTLTFSFTAGQTITQMWGGTAAQSGGAVTVTPADYTRSIPSGGSITVGFLADQGSTNPAPTGFTLNGGACTTA
ncbi:cellulose binding domain-containing protein [Streptomyces cocklensis]|uniref:cellulose binding domain-containing protein n=1 Tax=Actinacidiphila cocklensis TaxID=887465 RepID=UPI00203C2460|nr:cellulose binding domain-containing protein [Actinacidiphila cocklensis]MDD1059922.1 cellulose binding domain-containing protein [Actinacidiphila cocklensis]WSX81563.1 cellulose binding domain-containing protein [Streptomyces sp. NBC_00899]WSX82214.1 cellulose binding domain-containing protein [Streptomyces sp. NBC_00899]